MLNLNSKNVADNSIVINGVEVAKLNDLNTQKLLDIIKGMTQSNAVVQYEEEHKTTVSIEEQLKSEGKKIQWTEDFLTVADNTLYLHCMVKGDKGDKIRYAIKRSAKDFGATWSGDYDAKKFTWTFKDAKSAQAFIKARKEYAKKQGENQ